MCLLNTSATLFSVVSMCCVTTLQTKPFPLRVQTTVAAVVDWRRCNLIHSFVYLFIDCIPSLGFTSHGGTERIYHNNHPLRISNNQDHYFESAFFVSSVSGGCELTLPLLALPPQFPCRFVAAGGAAVTSGNQWKRGRDEIIQGNTIHPYHYFSKEAGAAVSLACC